MTSLTMKKPCQNGFTLVELMIALVLGLIVVGGSLALFVSQRVTSKLSAQMVSVQSEGRIALDAMARDIRSAGDFGCWPVTNPIDKKLNNENALDANLGGLLGVDNTTAAAALTDSAYGLATMQAALPSATPTNLANTSSVIAMNGVFGSLSSLDSAMASQAADLIVKKPTELFKANDIAVVTDCINWAKFQVSTVVTSDNIQTLSHAAGAAGNTTYGQGNKDANLGEIFGKGATVGRLDTVWWFMGAGGLYRMSARDNVPVLVSSKVAAISVSYDRSTLANGAINVTAQTAANVAASTEKWTSVRSATIQMLMRSDKTGNSGLQTVSTFNGQTVPDDNHVYLPLQMTVAVRNQ